MGTEQEREKAEAPKAEKTTEGGSPASAGVQAVDALLQRGGGVPPVAGVVAILERFPGDRDAIYGRLQQTVGNQYVQQVAAANPKPAVLPPRDLDSGLAAGRRATQMLDVARSTLFPAYRRAVDAVDPIASLELARNVVGSIQVAEDGKREVVATLGGADPHHFMTSAPDKPDESEAVVMSKWGELEMLQARLLTELSAFELDLSLRIGPQQFKGKPVLGSFTIPTLGAKPTEYLINEAGTVVELLATVMNVRQVAGATSGTCPVLDDKQRGEIAGIVEGWRSRPVNFAFLVRILAEEGIWDSVSGEETSSGRTLAQTEESVVLQAKQTGALADVGKLDNDNLTKLLDSGSTPEERDSVYGEDDERPRGENAVAVFEGIASAAPDARGPLVLQIQTRGHLDDVFDNVPWKSVQELHDAIHPYNAGAASLLTPFFDGKGGGSSMHKIYEDRIMGDLADGENRPLYRMMTDGVLDPRNRAFLWTFLDTAHNALTGGFEHEYSAAYDAHEQGLITDDEFYSQATKALGKAAVITAASALTGGVAGEFGEGVAAGLGATDSMAQIIGAGVGGFGAGVGGKFGGDVYDQMLNGKEGFDSFGSYMQAGAVGGVMGTVLGGVSVGAGKYLGGEGGAVRPIDEAAVRFPRLANVLEKIRAAGFATGRGGVAATIKVKMTVGELYELLGSSLAGRRPSFAYAGAGDLSSLPSSTPVEVTVNPASFEPMMMSSINGAGGTKGTDGPDGAATPMLEIERVEVAPPAVGADVSVVDGAESAESLDEVPEREPGEAVTGPRSGKPDQAEVDHSEKGEFNKTNTKLTGGGHTAENIAELKQRGFEELTPESVAELRAQEQPYEDARAEWDLRSRAEAKWYNQRKAARGDAKAKQTNVVKGSLKNPKLPEDQRIALKQQDAEIEAKVAEWEGTHPKPPAAGKEPKVEDFGFPKGYEPLSSRKYFYREPLGESGAEIGGMSSTNGIHVDGHTWFPPGWRAEPVMELLEADAPGVAQTQMKDGTKLTAIKRTAWIRQKSDGTYEIAPPGTANPGTQGYIRSSMIAPTSGAGRTVFPEMRQ